MTQHRDAREERGDDRHAHRDMAIERVRLVFQLFDFVE
jgi:hypothetical protein